MNNYNYLLLKSKIPSHLREGISRLKGFKNTPEEWCHFVNIYMEGGEDAILDILRKEFKRIHGGVNTSENDIVYTSMYNIRRLGRG